MKMTSPTDFALDPRIAADTLPLCEGPLSRVLMMDDTRFPWITLVPRRPGMVEMVDLAPADRLLLNAEIDAAAAALRAVAPGDKLNIGALGNMVRQLHVHVVMRSEGDAVWPAPVWGNGVRVPHEPAAARERIERLAQAFTAALPR
jgi:diadenosine tetraphosphate (Ap4A) HIT family hydrolase